jgi:hypothetical protein
MTTPCANELKVYSGNGNNVNMGANTYTHTIQSGPDWPTLFWTFKQNNVCLWSLLKVLLDNDKNFEFTTRQLCRQSSPSATLESDNGKSTELEIFHIICLKRKDSLKLLAKSIFV